jgi:ariadne-1
VTPTFAPSVTCSNLKRYLHYLTRFEANTQACKLEERIRKSCEAKADALMEADPSMSNFSWLNDALQQLFLARKCMAYSYIFAYFMFGQSMFREDFTPQANAINQALFEDKQGQLEAEVERLSQLIEGPFFGPPSELSAVRMAIVNLAANIDTRIQKMYEVGTSHGWAAGDGQGQGGSWICWAGLEAAGVVRMSLSHPNAFMQGW